MGEVVKFEPRDPEPEIPEHISQYNELRDNVDNALKAINHAHKKAQLAGEATILDLGPNALMKRENREAYADAAGKVYFDAAKGYFGVPEGKKEGEDPIYDNMLANAHSGLPKDTLMKLLDTYKQEMSDDPDFFDKQLKHQFTDQIRERLDAVPSSHLTDDHIDDIIKYVGMEGIVDPTKIRIREATGLLGVYKKNGAIGKTLLNKLIPDYAVLKDEYRGDYSKAA